MKSRLLFLILLIITSFASFATNRALVVGIGKYSAGSGWITINGDNDVALIVPLLKQSGFQQSNIKTLVNSQATKSAIIKELKNLSKVSQSGDNVYFHFSGHGQRVKDENRDETSGMFDQSIVPYDACYNSRNGYNGENHIVDDELFFLLDAIKAKIGKTGALMVVVDACYSQGIDKGEDWDKLDYDEEIIFHPRGSNDKFIPKDPRWLSNLNRPNQFSKGGTLITISASKSSEMNFQYREPSTKTIYGSLSYCIAQLLKVDANFSRWQKYFEDKMWKSTNFFPYQNPSIKVNK